MLNFFFLISEKIHQVISNAEFHRFHKTAKFIKLNYDDQPILVCFIKNTFQKYCVITVIYSGAHFIAPALTLGCCCSCRKIVSEVIVSLLRESYKNYSHKKIIWHPF